MNRYPWEFTAEEFLGPRLLTRSTPVGFLDGLLLKGVSTASLTSSWERLGEGLRAHYDPTGVVVTDGSGEVVGSLSHGGVWVVKKVLQGRGLISQIDAEYRTRYGVDPRSFVRERLGTLTPEAEKLVRRVHALCVRGAVERGVEVAQGVLDSVGSSEQRFEALRQGDDSVLQGLPEQEKESRRRHAAGSRRYKWVRVSTSTLEWLRAGHVPRRELRDFERIVVVG